MTTIRSKSVMTDPAKTKSAAATTASGRSATTATAEARKATAATARGRNATTAAEKVGSRATEAAEAGPTGAPGAKGVPVHRGRLLLARIRRLPSWSVLAAGALTGGLLGGAYGWLTPPVYTATSYLVAVPTKKADVSSALGFAQAYGRIATQPAVLAGAWKQAGVPVRTLQRDVRAETSPDAPMVAVSAASARPALAARMANAVSRALAAQANAAKASTQVQLVQFSRAVRPAEPTSASTPVTALVGTSAGGLLCGLALLARPRRTGADGDEPASATAAVPGPAAAGTRGSR